MSPAQPSRVPSSLALLYPLAALIWALSRDVPALPAFGYGVANLGYVLLIAGLVAGSFRVFGLLGRAKVIGAAVFVWIVGTVLSNL